MRRAETSIIDELAKIGGAANIAKGVDLIHEIISDVLTKIGEEIRIALQFQMNKSIDRMVGAGLDGGLDVKITSFRAAITQQEIYNLVLIWQAELGGSYAFISALYEYARGFDTSGFGYSIGRFWTRYVCCMDRISASNI